MLHKYFIRLVILTQSLIHAIVFSQLITYFSPFFHQELGFEEVQSAQLLEKFLTVQAVQAFWLESARGTITYIFYKQCLHFVLPFFNMYYQLNSFCFAAGNQDPSVVQPG